MKIDSTITVRDFDKVEAEQIFGRLQDGKPIAVLNDGKQVDVMLTYAD